MKNYFDKGTPLTISMWDYSWLQCGHPGGSFHDLQKCVEQAAERGYNTLRVDVFPHYYLKGEHTFPAIGADRPIPTWGDVLVSNGYTVNVRDKVIELANLCRDNGIWLGLDTWKSFEVFGRGFRIKPEEEETVCREWADTWVQAIKLMREDGVLERAAWVAPLNEVPIFLGNLTERVIGLNAPQSEVGDGQIQHLNTHHDDIFMDLNTWLGEDIKAEIEGDNIPLLYSGVWVENYPKRVPTFYDAVDCHFMPDAQLTEGDITALETGNKGSSKFTLHQGMPEWDFALFGGAWERAARRNYDAMLQNAKAFCETTFDTVLSDTRTQFEVICTEAYGPCNHPDHKDMDWTWYKHYNADAARIFAQYDFAGLTLSNHAEPLFSLWQDADWQARSNAFLKCSVR